LITRCRHAVLLAKRTGIEGSKHYWPVAPPDDVSLLELLVTFRLNVVEDELLALPSESVVLETSTEVWLPFASLMLWCVLPFFGTGMSLPLTFSWVFMVPLPLVVLEKWVLVDEDDAPFEEDWLFVESLVELLLVEDALILWF
jgi:hypothetical protein